jgi:hypothetical protein
MKTEVTVETETGYVYTYEADLPLIPEGHWVSSPKNPMGKASMSHIRINDDNDVIQYVRVK